MEVEIDLPETVPVMTLPNVAFFPGVVMPLHIFEPRYRSMLRDSLNSHRLFAVAGLDARGAAFEAPHKVATVGIVRACQDADNGTSNLLLHGLTRVHVEEIVREQPYRLIRVRALTSTHEGNAVEIAGLRQRVADLLTAKRRLGASIPAELLRYLVGQHDPEIFADLAAFTFCDDSAVKQQLLETLSVRDRLELLLSQLGRDVSDLRLRRKLQGRLDDEEIGLN
ncbi:LON peptidase substrate-binding domain-containing protein [Nibricoccus sp. IMCC34717]|uniref:LON peptidase substrate-binding domain-containing protein n=1 Tax=Nibricoccus sp. IMCC34717 TaxID=3034021 RepID=UPI00384D43AE